MTLKDKIIEKFSTIENFAKEISCNPSDVCDWLEKKEVPIKYIFEVGMALKLDLDEIDNFLGTGKINVYRG